MTFKGYCHETTGQYAWDRFELEKFRAICAAKFKGEEVELELRKRRTKRSDKQNRSLHGMLAPWCAEGHYVDDLKLDLLKVVFGTHERTSPVSGEVEQVANKPHTSQLSTVEFAELMEQACIIGARCGVLLELPDEYKTRKAAEAKAERKAAAKREKAA